MVRGEKPIEPRDSWFSAKFIEVKRLDLSMGGRALARELKLFKETPNTRGIQSKQTDLEC